MKQTSLIKFLFNLIGCRIQYVERLRAYIDMLNTMTYRKDLYNVFGFCLYTRYEWFHDSNVASENLVLLTELYSYKPEILEDGLFWFDRMNFNRRETILIEIIKDMNSKITLIDAIYMSITMIFKVKILIT